MSIVYLGFVNIALAVLLILWMYLERNSLTVLTALFVYGSIHFAYTSIPFFYYSNSISVINELHIIGSVWPAKLSGIAVFSASLIILFLLRTKKEKLDAILILGVINVFYLLTLSIGHFLNDEYLILITKNLKLNFDKLDKKLFSFFLVIISIQTLASVVALYELASLKTWATFLNSNGDIVYRASSIFFNPNVYGIWSVIVALLFSYSFQTGLYSKTISSIVIVQSSMSLFMSGSRSALLLLIMALILIGVMSVKNDFKHRWLPLLLVFLSTFGISAIVKFFQFNITFQLVGMNVISILADRIILAPVYIISYIFDEGIPEEVTISIEGRTNGSLTDSSWLTLLNDAGGLGVILFLSFLSFLIYKSLKSYYVKLDTISTYGVVFLLMFLLMGAVIRFQVFPVWLFFSVPLACFLSYWQDVLASKDRKSY
jgi:hypothetical protein